MSMLKKQKFSYSLYNEYDSAAKLHTMLDFYLRYGWEVVDDGSTERYQDGDIIMVNPKTNKTVCIEIEVKYDLDKALTNNWAIHIPYRKRNSPCDGYIMWSRDYTFYITIPGTTLRKYGNQPNNLIEKPVRSHGGGIDSFFAVPLSEFKQHNINDLIPSLRDSK